MIQIGSYKDGMINREWYRQGFIVKNEDAFLHRKDAVCYIPEFTDSKYTRQDFLDICNQQEDIATMCFYSVDWQHPETWLDEQYTCDELGWCEHCKLIYKKEGRDILCPVCGR